MKRKDAWLWILSAILVGASLATYIVHYLIFRDLRHIFFYTLLDIGFLFLNVLLVVLLIERLLAQREKRSRLDKLNMVIGTFFSEVGLELLKRLSAFAVNAAELEGNVRIVPQWGRKDFSRAAEAARTFTYEILPDRGKLADLGGFLSAKRAFLVGLLENPSLLEHESFTDLLWAVFHLAEELSFRNNLFGEIPESDLQHLAGDLKRAYSQIAAIWIDHVRHLKESYPFLFSLAARINPLNPDASVIVR